MVLYEITLVPLAEDLRDVYPTLLSPVYANYAAVYGLKRSSAAQQWLLMDQGLDRGYFPNPSKSLFTEDNPEDEDAVRIVWAGGPKP